MKRIKLVGAGFLLILIAMFLWGCDSPVTGIALLAGMILLFIGCFSWARKLHWYVALAIGGLMLTTAWLAGIYIPQIVIDRVVGDERNEFLVHLISVELGVPGIALILTGFANLFRWLQSLLEKQKIKKRNRVRLRF